LVHLNISGPSRVLFETVLEPALPAVDKLRKDAGVGEGEIEGFRGKKNRLAVGLSNYGNLITRMQEQNQEISYEINKMKDKYDFNYAILSCSFLPDNDCRFDWGRFGIELSAEPKSGEPSSIKPVAHYLFPTEVNSEIRYKREIAITPELKINLFEVIDGDMGANISESKEYIIYEPQITGFGINRSTLAWNFSNTKAKGICGDKLVLVVIRGPKNSKIKGRFLLGGEVSSRLSNWIPIPVSKRKDEAVDAEYDLSD
jgi:hypothetical protein